jgi:hypothetical protein
MKSWLTDLQVINEKLSIGEKFRTPFVQVDFQKICKLASSRDPTATPPIKSKKSSLHLGSDVTAFDFRFGGTPLYISFVTEATIKRAP